ncbi:hypothetical protein ACZ91_46445 [Streptomyces regensis]|nr:hypothetical protein ACZ91_46445 [Streptomyces regensis]KOG63446.1 hypothetical protein ADK77_24055 [Streptomyces antibioticus]
MLSRWSLMPCGVGPHVLDTEGGFEEESRVLGPLLQAAPSKEYALAEPGVRRPKPDACSPKPSPRPSKPDVRLLIAQQAIGQADEPGMPTTMPSLNSRPRPFQVRDRAAPFDVPATENANRSNPGHLAAPSPVSSPSRSPPRATTRRQVPRSPPSR